MSDYEEKIIRLMVQEGGRMLSEGERLQAENAKLHAELTDLSLNSCPSCGIKVENEELRKLVRCLVKAEHPSDRATLIANAADMLAELGVEVES